MGGDCYVSYFCWEGKDPFETHVYKQKLEARRPKKKLLQGPQQKDVVLIRQQKGKDSDETKNE